LEYYLKHGNGTETAIRYKISRKTLYKWLKRYDGTWQSLVERSRRPHRFPRAHTPEEIRQIRRLVKKHRWEDLILAYQELREKYGYTRSYGGFKRIVSKLAAAKENKKRKRRKNKPYQRAEYPGQKVQVDVKFVPSECVVDGRKYYQFTAVDECTRWTYRQMYDEHSTYSAEKFLIELVRRCPFPIREIQTDNGTEFTKALISNDPNDKSLFELKLEEYDILYHRIRIATLCGSHIPGQRCNIILLNTFTVFITHPGIAHSHHISRLSSLQRPMYGLNHIPFYALAMIVSCP
jgi:transposase